MGRSRIEYCDETWSPTTGCTPVSAGCAHCWAKEMARRFPQAHARMELRVGFGRGAPARPLLPVPFSAVVCHEDRLDIPLHWRKPRVVLVPSMGDLGHEDVPDEFF